MSRRRRQSGTSSQGMEDASKSSPKRKAAACDAFPRGGRKRRPATAAAEERDWTSLHPDINKLIADRLLEEDVTEYIVFRAVCTHWRASAPSPRDTSLADRRFHPRGWVALCEGTGVRPVDDEAITFFHAASGKVRRVHLWELQGQRIVGFTDGLILLLDTGTAVVRVLHPFTRVIVQLPHLAGFFHRVLSKQASFKMDSFVWLNAAVCVASPSSIAVVVWFPNMPVVICAEPSMKHWVILHINIQFTNTLPFNGRLYGVTRVGRQLVQIYPQYKHVDPVVAEVPKELGLPQSCCYYLVESTGAMLLAVLHKVSGECSNAFALFKVDLCRQELTRVPSLGDRALFLSDDRCLSVSARDLPSISGNCIYFTLSNACKPIMVHSLNDGSFESLPMSCLEHDQSVLTQTSVQPFTLADHLITYCHHREWTRGLMFHEFYFIPNYWDKLRKRIAVQDSEVVVPRLRGTVDQLKRLEIPDLLRFALSLGTNRGKRLRLTT
ncbi:uncharacterized protein LOC133897727 [Phragmites australis]|uniref:uncharacterized protein LOC133897727 n=1 Tax=Phragmites australis TaxID=29695 RepID=UPI002D7700CB|nr:uncharacterized protein LOC133897727 [Phragmites australis]